MENINNKLETANIDIYGNKWFKVDNSNNYQGCGTYTFKIENNKIIIDKLISYDCATSIEEVIEMNEILDLQEILDSHICVCSCYTIMIIQ